MITPRTLKGFRDYLPAAMIPRERLIDTVKQVYRSYGFAPIDTPALEYAEILLGKAPGESGHSAGGDETEKQMYRFTDHGGRDVGLRFDLTVPLARFAAQHLAELGTPLKRYQIATVWRGENTQRGRYREFMQCDFDTIGTRSLAADIETVLVIHDLFLAIGFEDFTIRVNNRMVLAGLLERLGLADRAAAILRALDKLHKAGRQAVHRELVEQAGATPDQAAQVLQLASLGGSNQQVLAQLRPLAASSPVGEEGIQRLADLLAAAAAAGVPEARLALDVSIARGLDYYTGTVYETFLGALPDLGSVCSGGRYDNLAGLYTKESLPGVGASLGLDRLLAGMEELGMLPKASTPAEVFVPYFDPARLHDYLRLAAGLRRAGLAVEVYPEPKKLGQQLKYADRRGFPLALIAGENEFVEKTIQVKDLAKVESRTLPLDLDAPPSIAALADHLRAMLNSA